MNIAMAVETSRAKNLFLLEVAGPQIVEVRIGVDRMASDIVAALAKEGTFLTRSFKCYSRESRGR